MSFKHILILIIVILTFIFISPSFAFDNSTDDDFKIDDYYFDSNQSVDGDGSIENPYNRLTNNRIKDNSNIHLADGKYSISRDKTITNISFIGSNSLKTVINGNNHTLNIEGTVNFINVTLTNMKIVNRNTLTANNTIFDTLYPVKFSYNNSYGGAIDCISNNNIYINNCTFINNNAQYGGAIYINGGNLTVLNSRFINNTAYNFGGAISAYSAKIIINNTVFSNDRSTNDAGGAIYLLSSSLNAYNLTINNCSSTFGSAITSLSSNIDISNLTAVNNTAKYDGGVIFQYYGSVNITSSSFINNTARNGAALFINSPDDCSILSNNFSNNHAGNYAGGVYLFVLYNVNLTSNNFLNNTAMMFNDSYSTSDMELFIGSSNYTLYRYNETYNSTIPSYYSLRDYNYLTPVKDQQDGGSCWAFAALASLESCILKASGEVLDLSEENMKNLMAWYSDYGRDNYPNDGGTHEMALAYLLSWLGPVDDSNDLYDGETALSSIYNTLMHVQNVLYLTRNNYTDNDAIKKAILKYGAVATSMYYDYCYKKGNKYIHYYTGSEARNHAVAIVGWDDMLNVSDAPGLGAWIVRNSWGSSWADGGYFYVSYYDTRFAMPGKYDSYTFILNDTQRYDKNYQYDFSGVTDYLLSTANTVWYENVFYPTENEFLKGVSTYFQIDNTSWELFIYVNSTLKYTQSGISNAGYYTFDLAETVPLSVGDYLEVVFKITTAGDVGVPISEKVSINKFAFKPGISYISFNGIKWFDLYDYESYYPNWLSYTHWYSSQVACIKAFTQSVKLNSTLKNITVTYDSFNLFNITGNIFDEDNHSVKNGKVIFKINNENYTLNINNGVINFQIPLNIGVNNISINYSSPNYYSSYFNTLFNVSPVDLDLNITVVRDLNNVNVNFTFNQLINGLLIITLNNKNQSIDVLNGLATLLVEDLDYGEYNLTAVLNSTFYRTQNSTKFFINVKKTYFSLSNLTTVYGNNSIYNITLFDEFDEILKNQEIKYILNNRTYFNTTNDDGTVFIPINIDAGEYLFEVFFNGSESYIKSQNQSTIRVNPTTTCVKVINITYNSFNLFNITLEVYDEFGNILNQGNFTLLNKSVVIKSTRSIVTVPLKVGVNDLQVFYTPPDSNYINSSLNFTHNVSAVDLGLNINVVSEFNNAYINFTFNQSVNGALNLSINNHNSTVNVVNGFYEMNMANLTYGEYNITAVLDSDFYISKNSIKFFVDVKKTYFKLSNHTSLYNSKSIYNLTLIDEFGDYLSNYMVKYTLDNVTYYNFTDEDGVLFIPVNLDAGYYTLKVFFEGDQTHIKCQNTSQITVKPVNTTIILTDIVYDSFNLFNVTVIVKDNFNNLINTGYLEFMDNYTVNVLKYQASVKIPLKVGENNIECKYFCDKNYLNATKSFKYNVDALNLSLNINTVSEFNNAYINFTFDQSVNGTLNLSINNHNSTVKVINGFYEMNLVNLTYGEYNISAVLDSDFYISKNTTKLFVDVKKTRIECGDLITIADSSIAYSAYLTDEFLQPVANQKVVFSFNNHEYINTTDINGKVTVFVSLKPSLYPVNVTFSGDDKHINSQNSSQITVKSGVILPTLTTYTLNSYYTAYLLDINANPLNNTYVAVEIGNIKYSLLSDGEGKINFTIPFKSGDYQINIINPINNEVSSQNIYVAERITLNRDISIYYGADTLYSFRVCSDDGVYQRGIPVNIIFEGKTYLRYSDGEGYVNFYINNLQSGTYNIHVECMGFHISNKIIVKKTLITKNIKVKKGKTIKFTAKLLNKNGKVLKAKKITFKFKGKTYKAKTNKKGIASIKIKNKYKSGKYSVITRYKEIKIKNTVNIKK